MSIECVLDLCMNAWNLQGSRWRDGWARNLVIYEYYTSYNLWALENETWNRDAKLNAIALWKGDNVINSKVASCVIGNTTMWLNFSLYLYFMFHAQQAHKLDDIYCFGLTKWIRYAMYICVSEKWTIYMWYIVFGVERGTSNNRQRFGLNRTEPRNRGLTAYGFNGSVRFQQSKPVV